MSLRSLFDVRPDERRAATLAFLALLGITAAHTLIETARDALFLAKVPVLYLPALYLAIAVAGLVTTRAGAALAHRRALAARAKDGGAPPAPASGALTSALVSAAVVTAGFWAAAAWQRREVLYALYVYSGMFASWVAGRLWIRLGTLFTVVQAKRLYGLVGTGGVLGAVVGAALARASLALIEVRHFLLVGAVVLVATALGPAALLPAPAAAPAARDKEPEERRTLGGELGGVIRHPYLARILALTLLTAAVGTTIDFFFKREVASSMSSAEIAPFLATVSLATNTASLVAQAVGVGVAMRLLGVHRALYVMPLLVGLGAGAAAVGIGLGAALALRAIDGTLRHSLQKTSAELLFVPLPDALRARAKPIVDLVGQRGGQAVTSIALLGLGAALAGSERAPRVAIGVVVIVLSVTWILVARGIRARYLDVFRSTLRRGRAELSDELPELDMSALEALIAALSSKKDAEVLAALDLLADQQRGRLIPSLVLFHPSKPIVLRALDLLVREGRTDFAPVADRLLVHSDAEVRAAALRARAAVDPDPAFLRELLSDPQDELRATALVALLATGELAGEEATETLAEGRASSVEVRRALARAIGELHAKPSGAALALLEETTRALAADADPETRALAATAMATLGSPSLAPLLVDLLVERRAGLAAVEALGAMGDASIDVVDDALDRTDLALEMRWRLVRALARSTSDRAVPLLARRLVSTKDIGLRSRILRALRAAQSTGKRIPLARADLVALAEEDVAAVGRALSFRLAHAALLPAALRATSGADLIQKLLADKEQEATDRLFLVLALLHPSERFARIQRGLESPSAKARASSRELIENLLRPPLRDAVLAVVDDVGDAERLARIGEPRAETRYEDLVRAMVEQGGELGALAAYHATEAGLRDSVRRAVDEMTDDDRALVRELGARDAGEDRAPPAKEATP